MRGGHSSVRYSTYMAAQTAGAQSCEQGKEYQEKVCAQPQAMSTLPTVQLMALVVVEKTVGCGVVVTPFGGCAFNTSDRPGQPSG